MRKSMMSTVLLAALLKASLVSGNFVLEMRVVRVDDPVDDCNDVFNGCSLYISKHCLGAIGTSDDNDCSLFDSYDNFNLNEGLPRTRTISVTNKPWPINFRMEIEIYDYDFFNSDDFIEEIKFSHSLNTSTQFTEQLEFMNPGGRLTLVLQFRVQCSGEYEGPNCDCLPRDDESGHYTCREDGGIACRPGYINPANLCNDIVVLPDLNPLYTPDMTCRDTPLVQQNEGPIVLNINVTTNSCPTVVWTVGNTTLPIRGYAASDGCAGHDESDASFTFTLTVNTLPLEPTPISATFTNAAGDTTLPTVYIVGQVGASVSDLLTVPDSTIAGTDMHCLIAGTIVQIICENVGYPLPTVAFRKDLKPIDVVAGDRFTQKCNTLTITGVLLEDEGDYDCTVQNNIPSNMSESNTLKLEYCIAPAIVGDLTFINKNPTEGDQTVAYCEWTGSPSPVITWIKDDIPLDERTLPSRFRITDNDTDEGGTRSSLEIYGVQLTDTGNYACNVSNALGFELRRNCMTVQAKVEKAPDGEIITFIAIGALCFIVGLLCAVIVATLLIKNHTGKKVSKCFKALFVVSSVVTIKAFLWWIVIIIYLPIQGVSNESGRRLNQVTSLCGDVEPDDDVTRVALVIVCALVSTFLPILWVSSLIVLWTGLKSSTTNSPVHQYKIERSMLQSILKSCCKKRKQEVTINIPEPYEEPVEVKSFQLTSNEAYGPIKNDSGINTTPNTAYGQVQFSSSTYTALPANYEEAIGMERKQDIQMASNEAYGSREEQYSNISKQSVWTS